MSTVREIEEAITSLSREDLAKIRQWLHQFDESQADPPHEVHSRIADLKTKSTIAPGQISDMPPSQIQPALLRTPEERAAAFQKWVDSHADVTAIADDSRESIYEGRGE